MNQPHSPSAVMDYLTSSGYEVRYVIDTLRRPLSAEKEYTVYVKVGNEYFKGTSGTSFTVSEERLLLGLLKTFKDRMELQATGQHVQGTLEEEQK